MCFSGLAQTIFIPPYGSMGGYLVYCVFVCLFFCMVTDFSAAEKVREIFHACSPTIRTGLLPFWEHWLAGSHGGCIKSGISH